MNRIKFALLFFSFLVISLVARANNITVSNVSLTGRNSTSDYTMVEFDLSWANSWRTSSGPSNWDAAWVFVKYRVVGGNWQHAKLDELGYSAGTGTSATFTPGLLTNGAFNISTNPCMGFFIYQSSSAAATSQFSANNIQLKWNYGADGVADNAVVEVKVFAIEMVYVPSGSYYLGGGSSTLASFYSYNSANINAMVPYFVQNEGGITIGTTTGNLYWNSTSGGGTRPANIPATFPKGTSAFYCMKYEISQQQYVEFLNTLTMTQQQTRTTSNPWSPSKTSANIGVSPHVPAIYACNLDNDNNFDESQDGGAIACNYLSVSDCSAYLCWAALRPMTEMEFEKACRGTTSPASPYDDYAWGTNLVSNGVYTISGAGSATETISANYSTSATSANAFYSVTSNVCFDPNTCPSIGPLRVGVFAGNISNTSRVTSGASYYGIMELSGNLAEITFCVTAELFTGKNGNGTADDNYASNTLGWSGVASFRGGSFAQPADRLQVAQRIDVTTSTFTASSRTYSIGFRGVRQP